MLTDNNSTTNGNLTSPAGDAVTTPKLNTFSNAKVPNTGGFLMYYPETNGFIALYPEEWFECRAEALENEVVISDLQKANKKASEAALLLREAQRSKNVEKIKAAQKVLDQALVDVANKSDAARTRIDPISDPKLSDSNRFVELLPLTRKRKKGGKAKQKELFTPIYVPMRKIEAALNEKRIYLLNSTKDGAWDGAELKGGYIKKKITGQLRDATKFDKEWRLSPEDEKVYSGILTEWCKTMGADVTSFLDGKIKNFAKDHDLNIDKNDPHRMIDITPEAQFMRWSAGAGVEANFKPFLGDFSDKRDKRLSDKLKRAGRTVGVDINPSAEASISFGEAKVQTNIYLPDYSGWHLSPEVLEQEFDLGDWRFEGNLILHGVVGASIAVEGDAGILVTHSDKQGLRGMRRTRKGKKLDAKQSGLKVKAGAKGEAKVFAGLQAGIDLNGHMQWLNPGDLVEPDSPKRVKPEEAIAEFADFAKVSAGANVNIGLKAEAGFECRYIDGRFRIAAQAGACLGLGGGGKLGGEVGFAEIGEFMMFFAHQLKSADYAKMGKVMQKETFETFCQIMFLAEATGQKVSAYVDQKAEDIGLVFNAIGDSITARGQRGLDFIDQLFKRMESKNWGWFAYMPPEARSSMINAVIVAANSPENINNLEAKHKAAYCTNELLATCQTTRHLNQTLARVNFDIMGKGNAADSALKIDIITAGTQFENALKRTEMSLAKMQPLLQQPFLRNDEGFTIANLPLHGATSLT